MNLSVVFLILAVVMFVLSTIPKIQRPWMIGIGLALLAGSSLPFLKVHVG